MRQYQRCRTCLHFTTMSKKSLHANVCSVSFCLFPVDGAPDEALLPAPAPALPPEPLLLHPLLPLLFL